MGPQYETTDGWQGATEEELEEAINQMKNLFETTPFEKRLQREHYRSVQRDHSRRRR